MTRRARTEEDTASLVGMGKAIEQRRREIGLTQGALALQAGVTSGAVGAIERGEVEASWATLRRIATGLNMDLVDLIRLAEQLAPGRGGSRWRRRSTSAHTKRAS